VRNQKIIVGIASYGMSGKVFHAPLLISHENFQVKRIIERSGSEAKERHPDVIVSKTFDDLLGDEEIDLVIVNTPDGTHFELTKKCLEAGKHIVVEKPFTPTVQEGRELIELARRKRRMLSVFQNRRWDGDFLTVRKIVEEHALGRLVDYEAHYDRYSSPVERNSWKEQKAAGAGVIYNLGSHMIDQALVLFGMPEAVTAHLKIVREGGEVDDWYDIRLHYPEVNVNLKTSLLVKEPGPRYLLHGTQGSFLKWGLDPQEEALKQGRTPDEPGWGKEPEESWGILNTEKDGAQFKGRFETLPGNYRSFYDNIYDCLTSGKELAVKPEEALNVIRIIEAAKRSNEEKRTRLID
jgi:scyllo-inositol 2-dehydrogenase (NADP+)